MSHKFMGIQNLLQRELYLLYLSFQPHYGPGVYSVSNRNEYQKYSADKGRPSHKASKFTAICEPIL
jgi:hypothetical protein